MCLKALKRIFKPLAVFFLSQALVVSCETIDPGERTAVQPQFFPDPTEFGATIHPILQTSCASTNCHGRKTTLQVHETSDPLPANPRIASPLLLPEPFRSDYFNVLYFVDLDLPSTSQLLLFGSGSERAHPGGAVLSVDDSAAILNWLESNGINP